MYMGANGDKIINIMMEAMQQKMRDSSNKKYLKNVSYNSDIIAAINHFFTYFRSVWVESQEFKWYEGSHPFASSNNQGIEGKNKSIKSTHTFRKKMPLGSFLMPCYAWFMSGHLKITAY